MDRRRLGLILMAAGAALAVIAVVGLIASAGDGEDGGPVAATTTPGTVPDTVPETTPETVPVTTPDTVPATTNPTTQPPATSAPPPPSTTTTTLAPTTTIAPEARIEAFVAAYASATDTDDADFLFGSLHPRVIDVGGEELCRAFVEREIVEISNYRLSGPITGPTEIVSGVTGYRAEVTFDFMGQTFTDNAQFAIVDGEVKWFSVCR